MATIDTWNLLINRTGTITSGVWNGTPIGVSYGGTGATTATDARTNLGLAIGTNVQAYDADLATIAGLTPSIGQSIGWNGTAWASLFTAGYHSMDTGFRMPTSGSTMSPLNHIVSYSNIGTTQAATYLDGEPGWSISGALANIGYTPSAWTAASMVVDGYLVMEQTISITNVGNYNRCRWGLSNATTAGLSEANTAVSRVTIRINPDGSVVLEAVDGAARSTATVSGLTWASDTAYHCLIACNTTTATCRIRPAGGTTVYTATVNANLPAAATTLGGQFRCDVNLTGTGGAWSALRIWRAKAHL